MCSGRRGPGIWHHGYENFLRSGPEVEVGIGTSQEAAATAETLAFHRGPG